MSHRRLWAWEFLSFFFVPLQALPCHVPSFSVFHPFSPLSLCFSSQICRRSCIPSSLIFPNWCFLSVNVFAYCWLSLFNLVISLFNLWGLACKFFFDRRSQLLLMFSAVSLESLCKIDIFWVFLWLYAQIIGVVLYNLKGDLNLKLLFIVAFPFFDVACEEKLDRQDIVIEVSKSEECILVELVTIFELFLISGFLVHCSSVRKLGLKKV